MEDTEPRMCARGITLKKAALIAACAGLVLDLILIATALLSITLFVMYYYMLLWLFVGALAAISVPFEAILIYGIIKQKWQYIYAWKWKTICVSATLGLLQSPIFTGHITENTVINLFVIIALVFFMGCSMYIVQRYYKHLRSPSTIHDNSAAQVPMAVQCNKVEPE